MQVKVENIPPLAVVYMCRTGPYGERNYTLMQNMKQWVTSHNLWTENGVIYGIALDNAENTVPDKCRYDVCFVTDSVFSGGEVTPISSKLDAPNPREPCGFGACDVHVLFEIGINSGTLPEGEYLVCEIPHTTEEVGRFYASIGETLSKAEKQYDDRRPILERYQFALVESGKCEFCVPVL